MGIKEERNIGNVIDIMSVIAEQALQFLSPNLSAVKEIAGKLYANQKQSSFMDYLKGMAVYFISNSLTEEQIYYYVKKMSDSDYAQTVTDILDSVFFSRCKTCRLILGIITGKLLLSDTLDYEDMVLIHALRNLFDEELTYFVKYINMSELSSKDTVIALSEYEPKDKVIIEKLKNMNLLGSELQGFKFGPTLSFEVTFISQRLFGYIRSFSLEKFMQI